MSYFVWCSILVAQVIHLSLIAAQSQFFPDGLVTDKVLSPTCASALSTSFNCPPDFLYAVNDDLRGPFDNYTVFDAFCSSTCSAALSSYHNSVSSACQNDPQPWDGIPATYGIDRLWAYQNRTCLKESVNGSYCTDIMATWTLPAYDVSLPDIPKPYLCSNCYLKLLQSIQSTPYSNYDESFVEPYKAAQAVCGVNFPTEVQPWPLNLTQNRPPGTEFSESNATESCFSGNRYVVASGDNCRTISQAKSVSTGALRVINNIFPDCTNLIAGASICLPETCQTYVVQPNDTCFSIVTAQSTTLTSLRSYNPTLNAACDNIIAGETICLSPPAGNYTPTIIAGATSTQIGQYATSTVAPPGATAYGTTKQCGKYYQVMPGDNCGQISINNTISVSLFEQINPSVNTDCTNLTPGLYYCVFPTSSWNFTSGSSSANATTVAPPGPTPSGSSGACYKWHKVVSGDYCALIQQSYGITFAQLQAWNPSLDSGCTNLILGDAYCVKGPQVATVSTTASPSSSSSPTSPPTSSASPPISSTSSSSPPTSTPSPVQSNMIAGCKKFYQAVSGDYCYLIATNNGIDTATFTSWNPAVGSNCSTLFVGYYYCVGV